MHASCRGSSSYTDSMMSYGLNIALNSNVRASSSVADPSHFLQSLRSGTPASMAATWTQQGANDLSKPESLPLPATLAG